MRAAASALRSAVTGFSSAVTPIVQKMMSIRSAVAGATEGTAARLHGIAGRQATLDTAEINTQTSTVRSSSKSLGLNLQGSASTLSSGSVVLDTNKATVVRSDEMKLELTEAPELAERAKTLVARFANSTSTAEITRGAVDGETPVVEILNSTTIGTGDTQVRLKVGNANKVVEYVRTVRAGQELDLSDFNLKIKFASGTLAAGTAALEANLNTGGLPGQVIDHLANYQFVADDKQVLEKTIEFGHITNGTFSINGTSITVDKQTDSVASIAQKITQSAANVTAAYDASKDRLVLTSKAGEYGITIGPDSSGFLAAIGLDSKDSVAGTALSKATQFEDVSSGSFAINGQTIQLDVKKDSLQDLLTKINNSGAGVTATFDGTAGVIRLQTDGHSESEITLGNDTTGFLAAAGLTSANTVRGNIADDTQALAGTTAFAGVKNGSFDVNGVRIAVDRNTDTLHTIVDKVNAANAGVTASYDRTADRLVFTPTVEGATLTLDKDTSGFLSAAHVATGARGTRVNTNAWFDGTNGDPLFDPGLQVTAGRFSVNGVDITVAGNDTINSVLAKITASKAGVDARFDSATESIRLTARGGTEPIELGDDTSGFLTATKLKSATATPGTAGSDPFDTALASMTEYARVTSGTITVNGQEITVDPTRMTLRDVVGALDRLEGVSAALTSSGKVKLTSTEKGGHLTVEDGTGLMRALALATGTHHGSAASRTEVETLVGAFKESNVEDVAARAGAAIRNLIRDVSHAAGADAPDSFREGLTDTVGDLLQALRHVGVRGLGLSGGAGGPQVVVDRDALETSLEALGDRTRAGRAVEELVESFSGRVADLLARETFGEPNPAAGAAEPAPAVGTSALGDLRMSTGEEAPVEADGSPVASPFDLTEVRNQLRDQVAATSAVRREERRSGAQERDRQERLGLSADELQQLLNLFAQKV